MKKYSISSSYVHGAGHVVEGHTDFETVEELVVAYKERMKKGVNVRFVGLSLNFTNSLCYTERNSIVQKENKVIMETFIQNGLDVFKESCDILLLKKSNLK